MIAWKPADWVICAGCGREVREAMHFVSGHVDGTTPPRKLKDLTFGTICGADCLPVVRRTAGAA